MWSLFHRYRSYLRRKALPLDGLALINEMRWQLIPWVALPIVSLGICKILGISGAAETWSVGPFLCLSIVGFALVSWEFFLSPLRNDFADAREQAKRRRK